MYKKNLIFLSLFIFSSIGLGSDLNCSIDKQLSKDNFQKLMQFRDQASSVCLKCSGKECEMKKSWKKEQANDAVICRLLFCTATNIRPSRVIEGLSKGRTKISFNYNINEQGKIKGLSIKSTSGKMNDRQAYKYLKSFTKKISYEPLVISGEVYQISNLSAEVIANIGGKNDLNKYNSADSKLWTN